MAAPERRLSAEAKPFAPPSPLAKVVSRDDDEPPARRRGVIVDPAVTRSARCASSRSGTGSAATTAPFIARRAGSPSCRASRSTRTAASWRLSASTSASPGGAGDHHASSPSTVLPGARHRAPGPLPSKWGLATNISFAVYHTNLREMESL